MQLDCKKINDCFIITYSLLSKKYFNEQFYELSLRPI